ncbi:MAG: MarR family transcriptional regulator [Pseudomonadota bacterium]
MAMLFDRLARRIHVSLQKAAPEFDTEKIGPGGAIILLTLNDLGPVPMVALARALVRDKSQMTRVVASLARKDLVTRSQNAEDSRVVTVGLTPKSRAVVLTHQKAIDAAVNGQLSALSEADRATLYRLLQTAVG